MPNDVVYQIVEDKDGLFWLTTNNGLVCFQPTTGTMKVYTTSNGLLGDQFNYRSSFETEDGTIYLGSIDGFVAFNPKSFSENKSLPSIVITDFQLFGKEVYVGEPGSPLEKSITVSDELVLQSNQNSFSFRLAALDFQAPKMSKIMYKLDGFDADWLTVGESPIVTYSNLRYGNYTFQVKVSNSDGVWNEDGVSLKVHILPPFYLSVWAYCVYALLIIGCSLYTVMYFKRRSNHKHRRQMEKFEQEKEREVYHAKIDFFTNVAHEIRTPLTLIKGPLENIILKKQVDAETREDLNVMKQNTERLLNLTNQLLDFRKTESQGFRLNFAKCNITEVLKETHIRFTSLAKQKGLDFTLQVPEKDFYAHVNQEAFTKIISNLLNNGVKYAESYVHISLEVPEVDSDNSFRIRTENDGVIIPNEMKEEIFKPFVRFNEQENVGEKIKTAGKSLYLALPRVFRGNNVLEDQLKKICSLSIWDGIYAYTINEMEFLMQLEGCTTRVIAGASFYHWNSSAIQESNALYDNMTVRELPVELSEEEISDMIKGMDKEQQQTVDFELLIYGRIPIMQSAQCLKKTCGHCNKTSGRLWLEDKKKRKLLVTTHCLDCYNLIWQDKPKSLIGENIKEVSSHIKRHRFDLFELTEAEVSSIKQRYLKWKEQHFTEEQSKDTSDSYWNYGIE